MRRWLPRLRSLALAAVGVWALVDASRVTAPPVALAGFFLIPVLLEVGRFLLRYVVQPTGRAILWAIEALKWGVIELGKSLAWFGDLLKWAGGKIVAILQRFWSGVLKPLLGKLEDFVRWVQRQLQRIFGPIIDFLETVAKRIREFYDTFIRPVLDIIDAIRQVLRLLGDFGIKWARELDRFLAKMQEEIDRPFRFILSQINRLLGILERIITIDGLLDRILYVRSLFAYMRETWGVLWQRLHKPLTPAEKSQLNEPVLAKPLAQHSVEFKAMARGQDSPLTRYVTEHAQDLRIILLGRSR